MTISAVGILANFSQEIHHWTILENTISQTIFWTRIRLEFLLFHDFWYFCYFPWLFHDFPWPQIFPWLSLTFHDCGNPAWIVKIGGFRIWIIRQAVTAGYRTGSDRACLLSLTVFIKEVDKDIPVIQSNLQEVFSFSRNFTYNWKTKKYLFNVV